MKGWDYPRHLAGRAFSVAVHGDAAGVENLRRILTDWLEDIGMIATGMMIAVIPVVVVYAFFSEKLIQGMTAGAVK